MKNILVVDNDKIFLKLMRRLLEKEGHQVETADDGLNALDILKTYTPDVIFVDLVMPNIDGRTLCRIIRGMENFKNTPIIILSATSAEELTDFSQLEVNACIAKGTFNETAQHVLSVLNQSDLASCRCMLGEVVGINDVYPRGITKELLSVKRHFEIMLDRMSEGILEINLEGRIVYVNSAAFSLIDIPQKDLLGLYFVDLFSGDDYQRVSDLMKINDTKPKTITDDAPVHLNKSQVTLNIIPLGEDESTSIIILHDVTERKKSEKKLRESEERYRLVLEVSPDPIVLYDIEGRATYVNPAFEQTFGWSLAEILGKRIDFVPEKNWPETKEAIDRMLRGEKVKLFETKRLTKDGSILDVQLSTSLFHDRDEKPVGNIVILRDITALKQAEGALQKAHDELEQRVEERTYELLRVNKQLEKEIDERKRAEKEIKMAREYTQSLIDSSLDMIISVDNERRIVEFNPAAEKTFVYSKEEVLGEKVDILYADPKEGERAYKTVRKTGEFAGEITNIRKNGMVFRCLLSAALLKDTAGHVIGSMGISRDIEEKKHAEEEREKLINELQNALAQVKTLRGLLPICSHCKNIRDDKGYWNKIESYIHQHSDAEFTHSICPECAKKHYPDLDIYDK
ncbi:PAS domain S-box protein [Thermodesulfobacteriota bacterium]